MAGRSEASRSTVLVVDNDESFLEALRIRLDSLGFDVVAARGSAQASSWLRERKIDVVLTDIRMPGLDGIGLAEDIRAASDVPIVLMTAFPEDYGDSVQHLRDTRLIAKPFAWSTLRGLLNQLCEVAS